jgi:HEAT repeat protein
VSTLGDDGGVTALGGDDLARRLAALEELATGEGLLAEAVTAAVVRCLGAPSKAVQRRAVDVLVRRVGDAPELLATLRAACTGGAADVRLRWGAVYALGRLGCDDADMLPALVDALGGADGDRRWAAAEIAVRCLRAHPERVDALLAALAGGGLALRKMAVYVLRDLAPGTPEVAAAVTSALGDADVGVRLAALTAVARLVPLPAEVPERVLALARGDADLGIRRAAVATLGRVGRDLAPVRALLDEAAASDDPGLRRAAVGALAQLRQRP